MMPSFEATRSIKPRRPTRWDHFPVVGRGERSGIRKSRPLASGGLKGGSLWLAMCLHQAVASCSTVLDRKQRLARHQTFCHSVASTPADIYACS